MSSEMSSTDDWKEEEEQQWDTLFAQPHVQAGLDKLEKEAMNEQRIEPPHTYVIKSFLGDAPSLVDDPVKDAMEDATYQANGYLEGLWSDYRIAQQSYKVISTATHAFGTGDYFNYVITLTIEFTDDSKDEEE